MKKLVLSSLLLVSQLSQQLAAQNLDLNPTNQETTNQTTVNVVIKDNFPIFLGATTSLCFLSVFISTMFVRYTQQK